MDWHGSAKWLENVPEAAFVPVAAVSTGTASGTVFAIVWTGMDNGFNRSSTMDSADLVPVEVDGQPLNEWATANEIGRSTAYSFLALVKGRGFEPEKTKGSGSKPLVILSGAVLDLMNLLLADHRRGMSLPEIRRKYETSDDASVAIVPVTSEAAFVTSSPETFNPSSLLNRLQAAELAITTGLPLTRQELSWIIGISSASKIPPSRIRVGRTSLKKWTLLAPTSENLIQVGQTD